MNLGRAEFDTTVKRAIGRIPRELRKYLKDVTITIRQRPSQEMLADLGLPTDQPLLGLYVGTPLAERSVMDPVRYPDIIFLFREPLLEMCQTLEELEEEIEITVVHEVAHYLGLSEERLAELGYG